MTPRRRTNKPRQTFQKPKSKEKHSNQLPQQDINKDLLDHRNTTIKRRTEQNTKRSIASSKTPQRTKNTRITALEWSVVNTTLDLNRVYVSQLIRYARTCSNYQDFMERGKVLTQKLLSQGYQKTKLVATLKKFYGRHHDLVNPYNVAVSRIVSDVFASDAP